jgi:acyl-CoA thioesterase FadM
MMQEVDFVYEVETEVADLDQNGQLKPYAYQQLFARIAEMHLNRMNLSVDVTLVHQLAWALITMSFELARPVRGCERLFATTWHSQRKGPYYRRELVFRDAAGELVFQGSTFSVLMDVNTRSVHRNKELPFPIAPPHEVFAIEAGPTLRHEADFILEEHRTVRNSHIDPLGHVNNIRYGEFANDAMSQVECEWLPRLRRMDMRFQAELRAGTVFAVEKAVTDTRIGVRGRELASDGICFEYWFIFQPPAGRH